MKPQVKFADPEEKIEKDVNTIKSLVSVTTRKTVVPGFTIMWTSGSIAT